MLIGAASGDGSSAPHGQGFMPRRSGKTWRGGIIEDEKSGALYGTKFTGGDYGFGIVYEITQ